MCSSILIVEDIDVGIRPADTETAIPAAFLASDSGWQRDGQSQGQ